MRISSLTFCGFRCFAEEPVTISLNEMTAFIGPNGSGKTAAIIGLVRLFGESPSQRQVHGTDFFLNQGESLNNASTRTLYIECRLDFPELDSAADIGSAVAEGYRQMVVDEPNGTPYCRMRLEATWVRDGTAEGEIDQKLFWILNGSNDSDELSDEVKRKVSAEDRARIRTIYIPATRDPEQQIKGTTATIFRRLLRGLEWNDTNDDVRKNLSELSDMISSLRGIEQINGCVQTWWAKFYHGHVAEHVAFEAVQGEPSEFLKLLEPAFSSAEGGRNVRSTGLSDGLRSLFSISLTLGLVAVEQAIREDPHESGFNDDALQYVPTLTLFAVEEPENHLSPQYLGQLVSHLQELSGSRSAQVLVSSHSPSILGRVSPVDVRYFLGNEAVDRTSVVPIPLPNNEDDDEAFKYIREAIKGSPELYFANLVILGEGPTEEIVLKRVFDAAGSPVDSSFISIVPLGGRHVNHFWRLLNGIRVPFLTLLDLDREKEGAGWGRIQYIRDQLIKLHGRESEVLNFGEGDESGSLADDLYDSISEYALSETDKMQEWLDYFESSFHVFFSQPLDLDFSLLEAFPDTYKGLAEPPRRGPQLPDIDSDEYPAAIDSRIKRVLSCNAADTADGLGTTYTDSQRELFPWYSYLFVDGSKPVSHTRALLRLDDAVLMGQLPQSLERLVATAKSIVSAEGDDGAEDRQG